MSDNCPLRTSFRAKIAISPQIWLIYGLIAHSLEKGD
jgi:hypothetical protein